ncbi:AraC family transcriptional regulator [Methyloceanibacter methanicus]|uniref:AraC family transcriptional regulator n=1 Tax=Methyloceanibacter methanicus TaxID=1774968 RepID=A0A1E3W2M8_9HYPH|nr:DJ-1/PfpI family protein [Methyloceanibacter methanicus]ODS00046.1 AraC family transcriptional regulator [Methyloceanibacter methanicus]
MTPEGQSPGDTPLEIGSLLFEGLDQIDLTGPFEVFARIPNATCRLYGLTTAPVEDAAGLQLTPDGSLLDAPRLDVLHIPGGPGQEALMRDEALLSWIRRQAAEAKILFSVCTGALLCGAAGLLRGKKATTYWTVQHLLPLFGATPIDARVVVDGNLVCAGGVTSGIDGALQVAAMLRGQEVAEAIQLAMQYAPEPPFDAGAPDRAPAAAVETVRTATAALTARREETARMVAKRLGIATACLE